jgi:hypothetical protein
MSRRSSSSYGPGTVKEHTARIKGQNVVDAPHVPVYKQSISSDPAAGSSSSTLAATTAAADAPMSSIVVVPMSASRIEYTRFKGCKHFRERLVCATLSGKPIRIDEIRGMDQQPGLRGPSTPMHAASIIRTDALRCRRFGYACADAVRLRTSHAHTHPLAYALRTSNVRACVHAPVC